MTWDIGRVHPFGKIVWDHEFASTDRLVTAALTTVSAPAFHCRQSAVVDAGQWGAGTAGARVNLAPGTLGYVAFTSQTGQHTTVYGTQFGINFELDPSRRPNS